MLEKNERLELIETLKELRIAHSQLLEIWNRIDYSDEESYILCDEYPFQQSFDELYYDIDNWVDDCIEKLSQL